MRLTRMAGLWSAAALGLLLTAGCPWFEQLPPDTGGDDGSVNDNGTVNDNGADDGGGDLGNDNGDGDGDGGDNGNDGGGGDLPPTSAPLPAKSIALDLIAIHDRASSRYDSNCIGCHGERTNEVALDGVTPAAHSVMQFSFLGQGNNRCLACHKSAPDFLSYSAGGLREPVNVERELAEESSCTSCHSGGDALIYYVRPPQ